MRLTPPIAIAAVAVLAGALIAQAPAPATGPKPAAPATAGTSAAADPVVAKVNNDEIHLSDIAAAAQGLPAQFRGMPPQQLYPLVLNQLIDQQALVAMAAKNGLADDPAVKRQMRLAADQALQTALISRAVGPLVTEAAIKKQYDATVANKPGAEEVHARHILVASEDQAKDVIAQLKKGASFEDLAKKYSTDQGAANGGDLGWFKKDDMVPEFATAAFSMKPGQISDTPVHSQFGWHVILVLETRQSPPPTFEQAHDELRQQMIQDGVKKIVADATAAAKIERFNLDGTAQRATDLAEPPPAPGAQPQKP
jgi:peptidyl-prolyl cis-trans isomerase C